MVTKYLPHYILNTLVIVMIFISLTRLSHADKIYTWVDKSGITHFSNEDNGEPGAKSISDTPQNIIKTNDPQNKNIKQYNQAEAEKTTNQKKFTLSILKPINNSTIQNSRSTTITVTLSGYQNIFSNNGYITLNVDNKINRTFSSGTSFYINAPPRGQHTLEAIAYNTNGTKIADSTPITFYIQNSTIRTRAGTTNINRALYENQTTKNYTDFQDAHQKELINPKLYNTGFTPTAADYKRQTTGK